MTTAPRSDALVFFGATGDRAYKMVFPALQAMVKHGRLEVPIVDVAKAGWNLEQLRARAKDSIEKHGGGVDGAAFDKLSLLLQYVDGDYQEARTFELLRKALGSSERPLHYLAIPPSMFATVVGAPERSGCARGAVVEKPFGRDLPNFVSSVQITMVETFGVKESGHLYEETGAIRGVLQNHMLQVVACLAMEAPAGGDPEALRNAKARVLEAIEPITADNVVRGQFRGCQDEPGVAADSRVETFAAVRLVVDSWRWAGVPFHIRVGKCLPLSCTEVLVELQPAPRSVFGEEVSNLAHSNHLRFRLSPEVAIALGVRSKAAGESMVGHDVELLARADVVEEMLPYERLQGDAMNGDATLFARQDGVEAEWRVVDGILGDASPLHEYQPGAWGPAEAQRVSPSGGWHNPESARARGST